MYTFNWVAPWHKNETPGTFEVYVDDKKAEAVFGATTPQLGWEKGGRIHLEERIYVLKLHDLTGFEGRVWLGGEINFSFGNNYKCAVGSCSLHSANSKPVFSGVAGAVLQDQMKPFDELLGKCRFYVIDHHIDTAEVVCRLNHIIHIENFIFYADGVGFKNVSGLIVGQTTAFDAVRVVWTHSIFLLFQ